MKPPLFVRLKRALSKWHDALFGARARYVRYYASEQWNSRRRPAEWLEVRLRFLLDRVSGRVPPKVGEVYLSHIPVLLAVGASMPVKRVLELGCGRFSTLTFLDRDSFPHLERLDSVENDPAWAAQVQAMAGGDARLQMHVVEGAVADCLGGFDLDSYDVIFVDDALTRDERARTIMTIGAARPGKAVTVIHDYDMPAYRRAAGGFAHRYRFTALYPNTGVAWNGRHFSPALLRQADGRVRLVRKQGCIPVDPVAAAAFFKDSQGAARSGRPT